MYGWLHKNLVYEVRFLVRQPWLTRTNLISRYIIWSSLNRRRLQQVCLLWRDDSLLESRSYLVHISLQGSLLKTPLLLLKFCFVIVSLIRFTYTHTHLYKQCHPLTNRKLLFFSITMNASRDMEWWWVKENAYIGLHSQAAAAAAVVDWHCSSRICCFWFENDFSTSAGSSRNVYVMHSHTHTYAYINTYGNTF